MLLILQNNKVIRKFNVPFEESKLCSNIFLIKNIFAAQCEPREQKIIAFMLTILALCFA